VVAQFADDLARGRRPELHGDGTQTRDFTHVDDVVRAPGLAGEERLTGIYNVGTEESYSFNALVDMLNEELGTDIEPSYVRNPIPESAYVHDAYADVTKLRAATGREPQAPLAEGIARVCSPYQ